jgi:hypothetical protein
MDNWLKTDPESAYSQMYVHATDHYNRLQNADRVNATNKVNADRDALNNQYSGLLTSLNNSIQGQSSARATNYSNGRDSVSNTLTGMNSSTQQTQKNLFDQQNSELIRTQNAQQQQRDAANNTISQGQLNLQGLISALSKPQTTQFTPTLYKPDTVGLSTAYNDAVQQFIQGREEYNKYNTEPSPNANPSFMGSQYANQVKSVSDLYQQGLQTYKPKTVNQSDAPGLIQNMTDFNNQVQGKYQGILSSIANLASLGNNLYTQGVAKRGELTQQRLTERGSYYANQPMIEAARMQGVAEQRGAGAINNQRQRTLLSGNSLSNRGRR